MRGSQLALCLFLAATAQVRCCSDSAESVRALACELRFPRRLICSIWALLTKLSSVQAAQTLVSTTVSPNTYSSFIQV